MIYFNSIKKIQWRQLIIGLTLTIVACWPCMAAQGQSITNKKMLTGLHADDDISELNSHFKIGEHPRLYLTDVKLQALKTRLNKYPYSKFWTYVQQRAESYARETPPSSLHAYDDNSIRDLGNKLPFIAIAYLITHDGKYVKAARKWMDALTSYPNWASNKDLGAAHILFGMSIMYDWMHDVFTEEELSTYRQKMISQADILYRAATNENIWWARASGYLQNHNYTNSMAIAVAGIALYEESGNASAWRRYARQNFKQVISLLSPDGASHEGVGYWGYGMDALLKYYLAVDGIYGMDEPLQSGYFRNAARFRLYSSLPDLVEHVDYADSPRRDWYGPGYILRALASLFRDGHAQWLAENIDKELGKKSTYSWLDLIWYDETVAVTPPDDLPTYAYFDNLGIFVSRTDWSKNSAWFFFKVGPSQGKLAQAQGIYSGSHIHPDEGNFLIASRKGWLVIDDGNIYRKRTENHNVL
ncbi:MAG: DUF4962 domain-containing protein, partial [Syntrophales bacterium]|nr:DUF4962 domain-containing protein [Syntrophales bacterium]